MNVTGVLSVVRKALKTNSPSILTALGVSGTVGTAYLTGVASYQAARRLSGQPQDLSNREKIEIVWDLYVPAVAAGAFTIGSILGANHISSKRTAAAYSLLAVTEKGFSEYKDKVIEKHGENKEKALRDELAQERIQQNPPPLIVAGTGNVLCCELFTGRYFNSDMETLRKAQNDINAKLVSEMYATLNDFYYLIHVAPTSYSGGTGWESSKLLNLEFSTVLSDDSRPCIAFEYNYTKPL